MQQNEILLVQQKAETFTIHIQEMREKLILP